MGLILLDLIGPGLLQHQGKKQPVWRQNQNTDRGL
jgi:hypothetical protein